MIRFLGDLPKECYIAVSGGPDSMAVLDFLTRDNIRKVSVLHVNHATEFGNLAENLVSDYCKEKNLLLNRIKLDAVETPISNKENYWREKRYSFFGKYKNAPIITCHNLNDCVETWIFSAIHGQPKLIPYRRGNVIRPFLITPKGVLEEWCLNHAVPYLVDPGNSDPAFMRSLIRTQMMPLVEKVNPGIAKVVKRKLEAAFTEYSILDV